MSLMLKILIFILFLGPLVFFHELGHFLLARLFGVRVEVFSIGFGPKILKWKRGWTTYALSIIPLGGYIKMFGDDPLNKEQIPVEERKVSFVHQGKMVRFWIVFGGPLANFILAAVIFFFLALLGEKVPKISVGGLEETSVFYQAGLRPGDTIEMINGKKIAGPTDLPLEGSGKIYSVGIVRQGVSSLLTVQMENAEFSKLFSDFRPLRRPVVVDGMGQMYLLTIANSPINWRFSLDEVAEYGGNRPLQLFPVTGDVSGENPMIADQPQRTLVVEANGQTEFYQKLKTMGFYAHDLVVKEMGGHSPAQQAGVQEKDLIISLNSVPTFSFGQLRALLQKTPPGSVELLVLRAGKEVKFSILPESSEQEGQAVKLIGIYSNATYVAPEYLEVAGKSLGGAFWLAGEKTFEATEKILVGFKKLITNEISIKNVGGPLSIGKVAADSMQIGISFFFQIMALISINLAVINLFPIPVLDGGHIMFILLELANRGPLSRKKMEIAQQFGLSLLLLLMVAALFNDFTRFF